MTEAVFGYALITGVTVWEEYEGWLPAEPCGFINISKALTFVVTHFIKPCTKCIIAHYEHT